jgi:hypothetical protein
LGVGLIDWVDCQNDRIAAFRRRYKDEEIWAVHNLSDSKEVITLNGLTSVIFNDLLTDEQYGKKDMKFVIELEPYRYLWLKAKSTK